MYFTKSLLLFFISYLIVNQIHAQDNLLNNPDFELSRNDRPQSWVEAGSVDFYRNSSLLQIPNPALKEPTYPKPCSGNNYIGIRSFEEGTEAAIGRFTKPLEKDQWYQISCKALMPEFDCASEVDGITVYPCDSLFSNKRWFGVQSNIPFVLLKQASGVPLNNYTRWVEVSANYQAKGGERLFWVGNFQHIKQIATQSSPDNKTILHCIQHVYLDSFSVTKVLAPGTKSLTFRNIEFASGSAQVTGINDEHILLLINYLKQNNNVKIKVDGHTDSDGDNQFNLALSQKRADAVQRWLVQNGIETRRILTEGYGEKMPLEPETSDAQKALNRRVEIKILEPR